MMSVWTPIIAQEARCDPTLSRFRWYSEFLNYPISVSRLLWQQIQRIKLQAGQTEVLGVEGDQRQTVLESGGGDDGIGDAKRAPFGPLLPDELSGPLADVRIHLYTINLP